MQLFLQTMFKSNLISNACSLYLIRKQAYSRLSYEISSNSSLLNHKKSHVCAKKWYSLKLQIPTSMLNNPLYKEQTQFQNSLETLLIDDLKKGNLPPIWDHFNFTEVMEYNVVRFSTHLRSLLLIYLYRQLTKNFKDLTEDKEIKKVYVAAWCTHIQKVYSALIDDLFDGAKDRFGREAWCRKQPNLAIFLCDVDFVRESIFSLLKKHFADDGDERRYIELVDIFQRNNVCISFYNMTSARVVESVRAGRGKPGSLDIHKRQTYDFVTTYSAGHYGLGVPVLSALTLASERNVELDKNLAEIIFQVGLLWTLQEDISDVFDDPKNAGKGKKQDVRMGDCNLVIMETLEICSPEQKRVLEMNVGMDSDEHEQEVMRIYKELDMENRCKKLLKDRCEMIKDKIEKIPNDPNDALKRTLPHIVDVYTVKSEERFQ